MFKEYERVMIIRFGMTGIIVDKAIVNGVAKYVVEVDVFNGDAPNGVEWPLIHCTEDELCRIGEPKYHNKNISCASTFPMDVVYI